MPAGRRLMLRKPTVSVVALAMLVMAVVLERPASLQSAPMLSTGTLTHLAVATPNVEATARRYADLFGIPVPQIRTVTLDLPNGSKADIKVANVPLPNFRIEL